ncbi:MAG: 50S ribosomal protein L5 [Nanoarchaeota archaeon]
MNTMRTLRIEKITLNIGTGKEVTKLDKALKLLEMITGAKPVKTVTKMRIPNWGLRPGLPIGCKVTVRRGADELLRRLLEAINHRLAEKQFDEQGNVSFGIPEYLEIIGMKYVPEIGIMGLQACVTLERPGYRVKRRRVLACQPGKHHQITKAEAIAFMQSSFNVKMGEAE